MKQLKNAVFSVILLSTVIGEVYADNRAQQNPGYGFQGVGISSDQYLGLFISIPASSTTTQVCNVDVIVNGQTVNTAPLVINNQSPVLFYTAAIGPAAATPAALPQYLQVNALSNSTVTGNNCTGLTASLGVYNQTSQDLQLNIPFVAISSEHHAHTLNSGSEHSGKH